jgi:NAD-dependent deacetylase
MDLPAVAERIAASHSVVALTGAGVSAESGIPTFRDPGGIWDRFDPAEVGTFPGLLRFLLARPWDGIEFLKGLRGVFAAARPNPGHEALAALERLGHLRCVITQNVDGLHQRAGSSRVLEMHGTFARSRCMGCGAVVAQTMDEFLCELDQMIVKLASYMASHPAHLLRRCECGGLVRWDFVAFGEAVQCLDQATAEAGACDVMLVCGTSGVVYPAAALPETARECGALVVEVNPEATELSTVADVMLRGRAGDVLPELVAAVQARSAIAARRAHADVSE